MTIDFIAWLGGLSLRHKTNTCRSAWESLRCVRFGQHSCGTSAWTSDTAEDRFGGRGRSTSDWCAEEWRKLLYLHRARTIGDLSVPPGNRPEALHGNRKGQHSIRINDQWRICFRWKDGDAHEVEIVDYH